MCIGIALADIVSYIEDCIEDCKDDPSVAPVFPMPEIVNMCSAGLKELEMKQLKYSQTKFLDKILRRQIKFSILNENVDPALKTTHMTCISDLDTNFAQNHNTAKLIRKDQFHLIAIPGAVARSVACPLCTWKNNFPRPLIQEEQVVSYWRKNGPLILVNCLREACPGTVWLSN